MNTIKIYLAESGRIADLKKDFPLYQYQYQNKLLNVFVPTSITAPQFSSATDGTTTADYVASTSLKIGMSYTARDGSVKTSKTYYMRYLKTLTYQNVEYALYERKLPKEFTLYAGQGLNAPILTMNVVNIQQDTESGTPLILSITASQACSLDVMASTDLDNDGAIEPTELENLVSEINSLNELMANKQNKTDEQIALAQFPDEKTVVGAINKIGGQTITNTTDISNNTADISALNTRVSEIEFSQTTAETPIGQMSGSTLPTDEELSAFVETTVGRQPKPNDTIIFVLEKPNATDETYKYIYYSDTVLWQGFMIPLVENAGNGTAGLLKGTYAIGSTNRVLIDIADGEIKNIFYLDKNNVYQNIQTKINLIDTFNSNIVDGTQIVGLATKAVQDQIGNTINLTYAKQSDVYTKTESDSKYLPSTYTNIYYYSADGLVEDIPTTPSSGIQFSTAVSSIGSHNIFNISRSLVGTYNFSKNSTDKSGIWVSADRTCVLGFQLTTSVKKTAGDTATLLATELTGDIVLTANTPTLITIDSVYSSLGNTIYKAEAGYIFSKSLDVFTVDSTPTTIDIYSNDIYPSSFYLSAQSIVFDINTINGIKTVNILENEWADNGDGTYKVTILQTRHEQAPSTNYLLDLQEAISATTYQRIAFTPSIDTDGNITLTAYEPLSCELLIGTSIANGQRGIITLTNPTSLPSIDYTQYGALTIMQTSTASALALPIPSDTGLFATFFVSNASTSTQDINVNNEIISAGSGMQFKWNGSQWTVGEQPTDTDEVYDKEKSQLLSATLNGIESTIAEINDKINTNASEIETAKSDITSVKNSFNDLGVSYDSITPSFANTYINVDSLNKTSDGYTVKATSSNGTVTLTAIEPITQNIITKIGTISSNTWSTTTTEQKANQSLNNVNATTFDNKQLNSKAFTLIANRNNLTAEEVEEQFNANYYTLSSNTNLGTLTGDRVYCQVAVINDGIIRIELPSATVGKEFIINVVFQQGVHGAVEIIPSNNSTINGSPQKISIYYQQFVGAFLPLLNIDGYELIGGQYLQNYNVSYVSKNGANNYAQGIIGGNGIKVSKDNNLMLVSAFPNEYFARLKEPTTYTLGDNIKFENVYIGELQEIVGSGLIALKLSFAQLSGQNVFDIKITDEQGTTINDINGVAVQETYDGNNLNNAILIKSYKVAKPTKINIVVTSSGVLTSLSLTKDSCLAIQPFGINKKGLALLSWENMVGQTINYYSEKIKDLYSLSLDIMDETYSAGQVAYLGNNTYFNAISETAMDIRDTEIHISNVAETPLQFSLNCFVNDRYVSSLIGKSVKVEYNSIAIVGAFKIGLFAYSGTGTDNQIISGYTGNSPLLNSSWAVVGEQTYEQTENTWNSFSAVVPSGTTRLAVVVYNSVNQSPQATSISTLKVSTDEQETFEIIE